MTFKVHPNRPTRESSTTMPTTVVGNDTFYDDLVAQHKKITSISSDETCIASLPVKDAFTIFATMALDKTKQEVVRKFSGWVSCFEEYEIPCSKNDTSFNNRCDHVLHYFASWSFDSFTTTHSTAGAECRPFRQTGLRSVLYFDRGMGPDAPAIGDDNARGRAREHDHVRHQSLRPEYVIT